MKTYKNYLFDLYGTLADIHTNESSPAFWRSVSRLLGMQGVDISPALLKEKYESEIARQEALLRSQLPPEAEPEVDLAPIFRGFFEDTGVIVDERGVADFARAFRLLSAPTPTAPSPSTAATQRRVTAAMSRGTCRCGRPTVCAPRWSV